MSHGDDLLRLLMPAVSPVQSRPRPRPDAQPIESRSFESLLAEINRMDGQVTTDSTSGVQKPSETGDRPRPYGALAGLSGIESIHNASLRQIVANAPGRK